MMQRLGTCIANYPEFFKGTDGSVRPGNMVDYLKERQTASGEVSITDLWKVVVYGLQDIWPESRTRIDGQNMGDVWELPYVEFFQSSVRTSICVALTEVVVSSCGQVLTGT